MKSARNDSAGGFRLGYLAWVLLWAGALACDTGTTSGGSAEREAGGSSVVGGDTGEDSGPADEEAEPASEEAEAIDVEGGGEEGESLDASAEALGVGEEALDAGEESLDAGGEMTDAGDEMLDTGAESLDTGAESSDASHEENDAEAAIDEDAQISNPDADAGHVPGDASLPAPDAATDTAVPASPKLCTEHCVADQDCWEAEFGFESCVEGRCTAACASHDECSDKGAQGREACTADSDCRTNQVCVVLGSGDQRCASTTAAAACRPREWPRIRAHAVTGEQVEVCMTSLRCSPQGCVSPCQGQCQGDGVPSSCDAATGLCVCLADTDCSGVANAPRCDVASGRCVCRADADCTDSHAPHCDVQTGACQCNADAQCGAQAVCRAGACVQTCEEASTCPKLLEATTLSCE